MEGSWRKSGRPTLVGINQPKSAYASSRGTARLLSDFSLPSHNSVHCAQVMPRLVADQAENTSNERFLRRIQVCCERIDSGEGMPSKYIGVGSSRGQYDNEDNRFTEHMLSCFVITRRWFSGTFEIILCFEHPQSIFETKPQIWALAVSKTLRCPRFLLFYTNASDTAMADRRISRSRDLSWHRILSDSLGLDFPDAQLIRITFVRSYDGGVLAEYYINPPSYSTCLYRHRLFKHFAISHPSSWSSRPSRPSSTLSLVFCPSPPLPPLLNREMSLCRQYSILNRAPYGE